MSPKAQPDFLKVRTMLPHDPRVVRMAEILSRSVPGTTWGQGGDSPGTSGDNAGTWWGQHGDNIVVGALVRLWSVVRHTCQRAGEDDALLPHATLETVDSMARCPGLGSALLGVGWLEESPQGVVLPGFFATYNADPAEMRRVREREKKQAQRAKAKQASPSSPSSADMSRSVPGTSRGQRGDNDGRGEERRGEENYNTPPPAADAAAFAALDMPQNWNRQTIGSALADFAAMTVALGRSPLSLSRAQALIRSKSGHGWTGERFHLAIIDSTAHECRTIRESRLDADPQGKPGRTEKPPRVIVQQPLPPMPSAKVIIPGQKSRLDQIREQRAKAEAAAAASTTITPSQEPTP